MVEFLMDTTKRWWFQVILHYFFVLWILIPGWYDVFPQILATFWLGTNMLFPWLEFQPESEIPRNPILWLWLIKIVKKFSHHHLEQLIRRICDDSHVCLRSYYGMKALQKYEFGNKPQQLLSDWISLRNWSLWSETLTYKIIPSNIMLVELGCKFATDLVMSRITFN